jgi:hypothetical protein
MAKSKPPQNIKFSNVLDNGCGVKYPVNTPAKRNLTKKNGAITVELSGKSF